MVKVIFLFLGFILGIVAACSLFLFYIWANKVALIGVLRMIFVGDHLERCSLEFYSDKSMNRAKNELLYGVVKISKSYISDPDAQDEQGM